MLTWDELKAAGQLTEYVTPGNVTKDMKCPICGGCYVCTRNFEEHGCRPRTRPGGKLTPRSLDRLPWKAFRNGDGEWIYSNQAPILLEAINNGHNEFGGYRYWTYEDNKFIARKVN